MASSKSVWVVLDLEQNVQSIHSAELKALREAVKEPGRRAIPWQLGATREAVIAQANPPPRSNATSQDRPAPAAPRAARSKG